MTDLAPGSAASAMAADPGRHALRCDVIIVTYNSAAHIGALLNDLAADIQGGGVRVVVVDNGSCDSTVEIIGSHPGVELLLAPENPGYGGGINRALDLLAGDATVVVLNPDLRVPKGGLARLCQVLEDGRVGIAVPTVEDESGRIYPSLRREPSLPRALGDALLGSRLASRPGWLSEMVFDIDSYHRLGRIDWATGAALAISVQCQAHVGRWDERRFFMYSEEIDFCRRAREAGFEVRHVPQVRVVHAGGGSGASPELEALMTVNRVRYYRKYHGRVASGLYYLLVLLHAGLRPHSAGQSRAVRALLRPSSWTQLPGGRARGSR